MRNAIFHCFKTSGKWYAGDYGNLSKETFEVFSNRERREELLKSNNGNFPGIGGRGEEFIFVVIPNEEVEFGFPLMLFPETL
jgi:hypothetical protein